MVNAKKRYSRFTGNMLITTSFIVTLRENYKLNVIPCAKGRVEDQLMVLVCRRI